MSVTYSNPLHSHPVNTTTTTTTTATTKNSPERISTPPTSIPRSLGWHAKASGFFWEKRSDQHRYRLSIGLPEIHAAVINHDWETASELLCAEDIGLLWLPLVSQRLSANEGKQTETGAWASKLPSKHHSTRLEAILQMAIDMGSKTLVEGAGCLYGANLLTLCLQTSAPPKFMSDLMNMITKHSPQYLNLPDASGRTPLYIAVDRGDEAQVRMLLDAGARPHAACRFPATGLKLYDLSTNEKSSPHSKLKLNFSDTRDDSLSFSDHGDDNRRNFINQNRYADTSIPTINAYALALVSKNNNIFSMLVEYAIKSSNWPDGYPISEDPLQLKIWASMRTEEELRGLASQNKVLKSFLFNLNDKSGSSIVSRALDNRTPLDEDIMSLFKDNPELEIVYAGAIYSDTETFIVRLNTWLEQASHNHENKNALQTIYDLFRKCHPSGIPQILRQCPKLEPFLAEFTKDPEILLSLPFNNFCELTKLVWPKMNSASRDIFIIKSAKVDSGYIEFIMDLPGFNLPVFPYFIDLMSRYAVRFGNTIAFELAASRRANLSKTISRIKSSAKSNTPADINIIDVEDVLRARSLLWFERLIEAGLNLQTLIDKGYSSILPLMADLRPNRLSAWLNGVNFNITQQTIDDARTPEGRDALMKLSKSEKADTRQSSADN